MTVKEFVDKIAKEMTHSPHPAAMKGRSPLLHKILKQFADYEKDPIVSQKMFAIEMLAENKVLDGMVIVRDTDGNIFFYEIRNEKEDIKG